MPYTPSKLCSRQWLGDRMEITKGCTPALFESPQDLTPENRCLHGVKTNAFSAMQSFHGKHLYMDNEQHTAASRGYQRTAD